METIDNLKEGDDADIGVGDKSNFSIKIIFGPMPFELDKVHFMVESWARMKSMANSGKSSGAAVLKARKGPLYILRCPMSKKQENPTRQIRKKITSQLLYFWLWEGWWM